MLGESVRFDDASRSSASDQPLPPGGVPRALRAAAEAQGLDPVAELYNEAVRYATEGHLKKAKERVNVLLALSPEDAEARLLLAKIHVAGQRWREALAALDEAAAHGVHVPIELRRAVEEHLRAEQATQSEELDARRAREQGEIKALRQEARRLRSENAQLVGRVAELEKEAKKWAVTTIGVTGFAILFILANLALGGPSSGESAADEVAELPTQGREIVSPEPPAADLPAGPGVVVETPRSLSQKAAEALQRAPGLEGTRLEVAVNDREALLGGVVPSFRERKTAERVLLAIPGIESVDASGVAIVARTKGTVHTVAKGDNLSKIAYEYYGESARAKDIQRANKDQLGSGTDLQIGMQLKVPAID